MKLLLLILLIFIPIFVYKWASSYYPNNKITILGISFGSIVAPFSTGLYSTYFIHPFGIVTGMLGLVMVMFHSSPGYQLAVQFELIPSHAVTSNSSNFIIAIINGLIWGAIYGVIGYLFDKYRNKIKTLTNS